MEPSKVVVEDYHCNELKRLAQIVNSLPLEVREGLENYHGKTMNFKHKLISHFNSAFQASGNVHLDDCFEFIVERHNLLVQHASTVASDKEFSLYRLCLAVDGQIDPKQFFSFNSASPSQAYLLDYQQREITENTGILAVFKIYKGTPIYPISFHSPQEQDVLLPPSSLASYIPCAETANGVATFKVKVKV
jgi:hypothetical protein